MNLLELFILCVSIYISFAGSPAYNPISSIIDESSFQSTVSLSLSMSVTASSSRIPNSSHVDESSLPITASSGSSMSDESSFQSTVSLGSLMSETASSIHSINSSHVDESSSLILVTSEPSLSDTKTPSIIPTNSIIDESSLQSTVSLGLLMTEIELSSSILLSSSIEESSSNSSGPWLYDTVDTRPPCITCYVLFKTNANTTRKCNPNHKFIWELWYNISGVQRGGYCIEFESLKNIEEINPQITSVSATSLPTTSTGIGSTGGGGGIGGSTTIYYWNKGQEITVKTGILPDCVPCYDFLHIFPKLSPFECNPGNALKVKVTYEVFTGMEETGYCAGQITMSERELRNIQKMFWFDKIDEPDCVECYDVLALGKNASRESCDNGDNRIWHVQYYKENWNLTMDGYCVNNMMNTINYWNIMDDILFAHIYRLDLSGYHYWMSNDATEMEKTTCKPCAKVIYEHKNTIDECKSNGHPLWQIWFNTTYDESYGGYCIDFMEIDLGLLDDDYIKYILAINESSTYEWFKSGTELKQMTESYPPCVNCVDLADNNTYLSSFYCDPRNQTKVKVDFTTMANKRISGYCAGFFYNYTVGKTQYKPTHIEMNDIFNVYSWNERCADCYDVFMSGSKVSRQDCDHGNETLWRAYYVKKQYYVAYNPEFIVDGFCINFTISNIDSWIFPDDIIELIAHTIDYTEYDYWYRQDCVSCYDALVFGHYLSHKRCATGNEQRWKISIKYANLYYGGFEGYCKGLNSDSLDSWNINNLFQNVSANNGTATYSWQRPLPSPVECVSCFDVFVNGAALSAENCIESEKRWQIQYYFIYYGYAMFGYCNGLDSDSFNIWSIDSSIQYIYAYNKTESYSYYRSEPSLSSTSDTYSETYSTTYINRCISCYELLLYRSSIIPNCDPEGKTVWDIWFNSTDTITDGGFCVDFYETDFTGFSDSITYIRASNESSTVEWFKSDPEIKEITETFPPCVECYDVAYSNITFSTFDCDQGYQQKIRARFTNSLGEENIGYCVGVGSYDFTSTNITDVQLYDRYGTYYMPNSQSPT